MTTEVSFGKLEWIEAENHHVVKWSAIDSNWKIREDDGTSKEFTIFSGSPIRSFSNFGFKEWARSNNEAGAILKLCKPEYPYTNDLEMRRVDKKLLDAIRKLPESGDLLDIDRAKWFKYWARRAVEEFGEEAYISFS